MLILIKLLTKFRIYELSFELEFNKLNMQESLDNMKQIHDAEDLKLLINAIDDLSKHSMKLGEIIYKQNEIANNDADKNNDNKNDKDGKDDIVDV